MTGSREEMRLGVARPTGLSRIRVMLPPGCSILLYLALSLSGCMGMAFGQAAVPLMAPEQLEVLDILRGYGTRSTEADIAADFGPPIKGAGSARPVWEISHNGHPTRIYAYFIGGALAKVHYFSIDPRWGHVLHYRANGPPAEMDN